MRFEDCFTFPTLTALICFASFLWWRWWQKPHSRFPPGPRGLPLLGVLPYLSDFPHEEFKKWSLKYGSVMSLRLGTRDVVVLSTYDAIKQAFLKQSAEFSGRMDLKVFTQVTGQLGIMFKDYSEDFKRQRSFGMQVLKRGGMENNQMEKILTEKAENLINVLKKQKGKPIVMNSYMYRASSQVAAKVVLGIGFEEENPILNRFLQILKFLLGNAMQAWQTSFLTLFWSLRHIPPFMQANKVVRSNLIELKDLVKELVTEREKHFDPDNADDFLGAFLLEKLNRGAENNPDFSEDQMVMYTRDIFLGVIDTTSTAICWALIYLLHNPQYYKAISAEIDRVLDEQPLTLAIKEDLPFTCAFLQENFRYRPPAPMSHHKTTVTAELLGYTIPKGTQIVGNFYGACWDPDTWPEPKVFNPYRHINSDGKFVFSPSVCAFSVGARFCMGERLARAEVFHTFVSLLRHFHIEAANVLPSTKPLASNLVLRPHEFQVILTERQKS